MASRHRKTYEAIHANPVRANIAWNDVMALFRAFGASIIPIGGSMHSIEFDRFSIVLHKPHPGNEINRDGVRRIRVFLEKVGVNANDL